MLCTREFCPHSTPVKGTGTIISTSMKKLSHRSEMTCPYQPMIGKHRPGLGPRQPGFPTTLHSAQPELGKRSFSSLRSTSQFPLLCSGAGSRASTAGSWGGGLSTVPSPQGGSIQWAEHSTAIQCTRTNVPEPTLPFSIQCVHGTTEHPT